jgi:hypothetical protein
MKICNSSKKVREETLCVYGGDLQEALSHFSPWLAQSPTRRLVVFNEETFLQKIAQDELLRSLHLNFLPNATDGQRTKGEKLFVELQFLQVGFEGVLANVYDQGRMVLDNILHNLPKLSGSYPLSALKNSFSGIPALLCGAGPSLGRHFSLLQAAKEKMVLFAAGNAIQLLHNHRIMPHALAYLDPNSLDPGWSFDALGTLPLFFSLRANHHLVAAARGSRIWVANGESYPIESWLVEQLGIHERGLSGGWNVLTFCISLSALMGCNPIILVGGDLSFPGNLFYTDGVPGTHTAIDVIETEEGKTKKDFLLAADWIEQFAEEHPEIELINVAEEAWKIPGVHRESLRELIGRFPDREVRFDFPEPLLCDTDQVIHSWEGERIKARRAIVQILYLIERRFPEDPRGSGEYALYEVEFQDLPIFEWFLRPIWEVWSPVIEREAGLEGPYPGFKAIMQKWLFLKSMV